MMTTETTENVHGDQRRAQGPLVKCTNCRTLLYVRDWERNFKICLSCGYHFCTSAAERIACLLDAGSFVETDKQMKPTDPLGSSSRSCTYEEKLGEEQRRTGLGEAVITGFGSVEDHPLALAVMDFRFMGESMGSVVDEKVTRVIELAQEKRIPLLMVSASGGDRIQEGIFSLMHMAKTSVGLSRLSEARIPFISLLTKSTTGGVITSFAMQGDVILAEPGAFVEFADPPMLEQFIHRKLLDDTNTAEFMLEYGMIDAIVPRPLFRSTIARLLNLYLIPLQKGIEDEPPPMNEEQKLDNSLHKQMQPYCKNDKRKHSLGMEPQQHSLDSWERVQLARHLDRPQAADYIRHMCKSFFELRGDRRYADDPAIMGGVATFIDRTVMLIGNQKGRDIKQRQACNFGIPRPEGYRKVQRLMRQAEKFGFPVICLIDALEAYPGFVTEQRERAQAIVEGLAIMTTLRVPTVAVVIGESGSGGVLALGLADRVLMLEHSIYTVASPRAAASILWHDNKLAAQAAEVLHTTALDILTSGVIDGIIPEPLGGAHLDHSTSARFLAKQLQAALTELVMVPIEDLLEKRHTKFRNLRHFSFI